MDDLGMRPFVAWAVKLTVAKVTNGTGNDIRSKQNTTDSAIATLTRDMPVAFSGDFLT